jgi:hypothetical protein
LPRNKTSSVQKAKLPAGCNEIWRGARTFLPQQASNVVAAKFGLPRSKPTVYADAASQTL